MEEAVRAQRERVSDLTAALASSQQMRDALTADLRYHQARIEEFELVRETASQLEHRHGVLAQELEVERNRVVELAGELELRERNFEEIRQGLERELAVQQESLEAERAAAEGRAGALEAELRSSSNRARDGRGGVRHSSARSSDV